MHVMMRQIMALFEQSITPQMVQRFARTAPERIRIDRWRRLSPRPSSRARPARRGG